MKLEISISIEFICDHCKKHCIHYVDEPVKIGDHVTCHRCNYINTVDEFVSKLEDLDVSKH